MASTSQLTNGTPLSVSLNGSNRHAHFKAKKSYNKKRILLISVYAVLIAILVSFIAKTLIYLIDFFTNLAFYGNFSIHASNPSHNQLGIFVIAIPVIGGLIVGLMALYGSKAIRGHGIPEAMEQILTNQSKIKPSITILKPLSAAISIGTGGPFGAEGPIIATGGALGSTFGQLLRVTPTERKILLAGAATAGMSAIFGSPIAAIFLAIELLLFEFSPRSFIPVALSCLTGAAGHHLLFETSPVFAAHVNIPEASNMAVVWYAIMGIAIGIFAVLVTKAVYFIEDMFEKLPIHWAWWPAIGGLVVGIVGYYAPRTLGVGYYNITGLLSGSLPINIVLSLCFLKFLSWAIALGSGTSGGTLAPLLTIGGAAGVLLGTLVMQWFPTAGVSIPLAALVGMAAMFAGASRAFLTSIVFALETTGQPHTLLALLAGCTTSYFISYFLMDTTIMTEKIARRGVHTPHAYEPDPLEKIKVKQVMNTAAPVVNEETSIAQTCELVKGLPLANLDHVIISGNDNSYKGIVNISNLHSQTHTPASNITTLMQGRHVFVAESDSLRIAAETMAEFGLDALPVVADDDTGQLAGILSGKEIIASYKHRVADDEQKEIHITFRKKNGAKTA